MRGIKPLADQVLVTLIEDQKLTSGGIHLPENSRSIAGQSRQAIVTELGEFPWPDDRKNRKWPYEPGNVVLIRNGAGVEVKVNEFNCQLLSHKDIIGVVQT